MSTSPQSLFIKHPTIVYLSISLVLALFALHISPSFVPLVLLLATLRLYITSVIRTNGFEIKIIIAIICLSVATTIANIGFSLNVVSGMPKPSAVSTLFILTCLTSTLIIASILLENVIHPSSPNQWSKFVLFPTVWTTVMLLAATFSPLGYMATWTPVLGVGAYSWTRPFLGPAGIDWAVGAWASVISELMGTWIMHSEEEQPKLIITSDNENTPSSERGQKSPYLLIIIALLSIASLPSYFIPNIPIPTNSGHTIPLPLACIHPYLADTDRLPSFDEYLEETMRHTSLAKVVLWPEGAVKFENEFSKQEAISKVAYNAAGSVIGVSFYERLNDTKQGDKFRNGFMLIDRNGLQFEYFKRHLVPYAESNTMVAYDSPPSLFDYILITKRNSRGKPTEHVTVSITASICLDFAHPRIFGTLERRPNLILAPGRTWHTSIGAAMWEQAQARAEETGSTVLWCDGGSQGVNGVGGHGMGIGSVVRVGPGSWVHTIGLEVEPNVRRTAYAHIGPWLTVFFVWLVFGTEKTVELGIRRARGEPVPKVPPWLFNVPANVRETYLAYRRGRERIALEQGIHEQTSLLG